jgi:DHA1 family multidrug resistance protein-like MFS transporter
LPTALAYIADTTTSEDRARGMGLMGAAMGLGMIFGPLVGGPLTRLSISLPASWPTLFQISLDPSTGEALNLSLPFYASSLCSILTIPLVLAILPESLPAHGDDRSTSSSPSRARLLVGALSGPMAFLFIMAFLLAFAMANLEAILGLFGKDRFAMGPSDVGLVMGLIGGLSVIQQGLLIGPLTKRIGEEQVLRWGLAVSIFGLAGISLAPQIWQMIAFAAVFNAGNSLLRPSVASLISQRALTGQGVAMGLENSFMSLGRAFGPMWAGLAYDLHPSSPFWTASFVQIVALLLSFRYLSAAPREALAQAAKGLPVDQA